MTRFQLYRPSAKERKWLRQEVSRRLRAKLNYKTYERGQRNLDRDLRNLGIDIPLTNADSINRERLREVKERGNG